MIRSIAKQIGKLLPLLLMLVYAPTQANIGTPASVVLDGKVLSLVQPAMVYHGRVLVPLRGIFERLGANVTYNPNTRGITCNRGNTNIILSLGGGIATINGETHPLDVTPVNLNGRVLVPLRFVSEALGATVSWDTSNRVANILSGTGGPDLGQVTTQWNSGQPEVQQPQPIIQTPPVVNRLITGISVTPKRAKTGDTVTVTATGTPGGNAAMSVGSDIKMPMQETVPGKYVGTYIVPAGMEEKNLDVSIELTLPNGTSDSMSDMNALSVHDNRMNLLPGGVLPFQVITPNPASEVPQIFDLSGTTVPNAIVRIRVLANQHDEILNTQTVADAQGNFHITVDTGSQYGRGTHLIVQMYSEDASGRSSDRIRMELTKQ